MLYSCECFNPGQTHNGLTDFCGELGHRQYKEPCIFFVFLPIFRFGISVILCYVRTNSYQHPWVSSPSLWPLRYTDVTKSILPEQKKPDWLFDERQVEYVDSVYWDLWRWILDNFSDIIICLLLPMLLSPCGSQVEKNGDGEASEQFSRFAFQMSWCQWPSERNIDVLLVEPN